MFKLKFIFVVYKKLLVMLKRLEHCKPKWNPCLRWKMWLKGKALSDPVSFFCWLYLQFCFCKIATISIVTLQALKHLCRSEYCTYFEVNFIKCHQFNFGHILQDESWKWESICKLMVVLKKEKQQETVILKFALLSWLNLCDFKWAVFLQSLLTWSLG